MNIEIEEEKTPNFSYTLSVKFPSKETATMVCKTLKVDDNRNENSFVDYQVDETTLIIKISAKTVKLLRAVIFSTMEFLTLSIRTLRSFPIFEEEKN
ncbi:hypothetical protein M0812_18068 [Anaeramoeba flamelloides]|uniref:Transcription factor Pcc1 n=1 Tax=Anaeramoeba flamelloides TaxID=1746091 RepID=A0AAV7Z4I4_9EUKA|nr:hypothetical protein M0812_18068 [Anaeramoeba flamelloides]